MSSIDEIRQKVDSLTAKAFDEGYKAGYGKAIESQKAVTIPHELIEKLVLCVVDIVENIDWDKAIDTYTEAYNTRPQGEWIPVSESLPEDGQFVLFCDIDDDIMVGYHVKSRPKTHFTQAGMCEDMKNVRAWMPLPEPYNGGDV